MVLVPGLTNYVHNVKEVSIVANNLFKRNAVLLGEESSYVKVRDVEELLRLFVPPVTFKNDLCQLKGSV